jgi:hypothetical protein
MKRRPRALLTLTLLVAWGAPLGAALGPRYGGGLKVGVLELPASLEPGDGFGRDEALSLALVHDTLVRIDRDGTPAPALAVRWTSAAEGREWTLWLRPGLRFHDGSSMTSADAARSIRRFVRGPSPVASVLAEELEGGPAFRAGSTPELPGVSSPGPDRLLLRFPAAPPLPMAPLAAVAAAVTGGQGAGAGPFVPNLHVPGRRLALIPFADHWAGRPYLDSLDLLAGTGPEALAADFDAGRLDLLPGGPGFSRQASTLLLTLDASRPPFDRVEAREAVDAALERMELTRLLPGADPARVLLPPALLPPLAGAPHAGLGARLDAEVDLAVERDVAPLASQRLVALLADLGLRVRVIPKGPAEARTAPAALRLFAWSPQVPEAHLALRELAALAGAPQSLFEALAGAGQESDLDRRRARLHRIEEALGETRLVMSLGVVPVSAAGRAGVHGVVVDDAGRIRLEDAWVEP